MRTESKFITKTGGGSGFNESMGRRRSTNQKGAEKEVAKLKGEA